MDIKRESSWKIEEFELEGEMIMEHVQSQSRPGHRLKILNQTVSCVPDEGLLHSRRFPFEDLQTTSAKPEENVVATKTSELKTKQITEDNSGNEKEEQRRKKFDEDRIVNQDKVDVSVSKKHSEAETQTKWSCSPDDSSNASTVNIVSEDEEKGQEIDNSQQIIYLQGYPLTPSTFKKSEIIPDPCMFEKIDKYMEETPSHRTESITALAAYICNIATLDLLKIRAIHQWIVGNIRYDVIGFETGVREPCDAESVLRNRCCVCAGYSNLFIALCRKCGIIVEKVVGLTKLKPWNQDSDISTPDDSDHAWNAVYIHNEWRLIDCTWDAGHLDNKEFVRKKGDFYFMTDPDIFLNDHFPFYKDDRAKSESWQLTKDTVSYEMFCKRLRKSPYTYQYQVEPVSHIYTTVDVDKEVEISVKAYPNSLCKFSAHLKCSSGNKFDNSICFYRKENNVCSVKVKPPDIMQYSLEIFGSTDSNDKTIPHLFTYTINCKSTHFILFPYPSQHTMYGVKYSDVFSECTIRFPTQAVFQSTDGELKMSFPIQGNSIPYCAAKLSHAEDEEESDVFVYMERVASEMRLSVRLSRKGYYKLNLYTQNPQDETDKCSLSASYLIECDSPLVRCAEYPKWYSNNLETEVSLLEPLNGVIPENTETRFRLHSPTLDEIMLKEGEKRQYYNKDYNNIFDITATTPSSGHEVSVYGRTHEMTYYTEFYVFKVKETTEPEVVLEHFI